MVDLVASRSGMDRATLYYYFGSREELIFSTYRRSCELVDAYIAEAVAESASAIEALERLVRKIYLSPTPIATLSEVGSLGPKRHQVIDDLREGHWRKLSDLIARGQKDGTIARCRPDLAARALEGVLAWTWSFWIRDFEKTRPRETIADEMVDVLLHGRRPVGAPAARGYAIPRESCLEIPPAGFDRDMQAEQKRDAMLTAATRLLNRKGVNGTTLTDIVKSLNVTKGAFYHYFDSKEDLIFRCYSRSQQLTERYIWMVQQEPYNGLEMIQACAYHNFTVQMSAIGPLTLFNGYGSLAERHVQQISARAAMASGAMREMIYRGMEDGSVRRHDATLSQRVFAGASGWLPMWWDPDTGITLDDVADTFIPIYTDGFKRRPD